MERLRQSCLMGRSIRTNLAEYEIIFVTTGMIFLALNRLLRSTQILFIKEHSPTEDERSSLPNNPRRSGDRVHPLIPVASGEQRRRCCRRPRGRGALFSPPCVARLRSGAASLGSRS